MNIVTSKIISDYYHRFHKIEVTFTKELIRITGLLPEQVRLKQGTDFWPCVLYAASFEGAKIVASNRTGILAMLEKGQKTMGLRFSFKNADNGSPVTFFVTGVVTHTFPYMDSEDVFVLNFQFSKRPPDYLVETIGHVLDADVNCIKRKDEHIILAEENIRRLKLSSRETPVFIQQVPRRCILRELNFTNAKFVIMGDANLLLGQEVSLRIDFEDPRESIMLKGKISSSENIAGKQDVLGLNMEFDETAIPRNYKIRINDYLCAYHFSKRAGVAVVDVRKKAEIPILPKEVMEPV